MNAIKEKPGVNKGHSIHQEKLSQIFNHWREAEGKVSLYGPTMPQAKQVIEAFHLFLEKIFTCLPFFSIVKKAQAVEIMAKDSASKADLSQQIPASANTAQAVQVLDKFKIQSITFNRGLTLDELNTFFTGLHMSPGKAKQQPGLADYLESHRVVHIKLNQQRFKLMGAQEKDVTCQEVTRTAEAAINDMLKQAQQEQVKGTSIKKRVFESTWQKYLTDQLGHSEFKAQHRELIDLAQKKPEELVRVLEHMAAKQREIEAFLANLEQKLFDVGFPKNAIAKIKKKLLRPKRVSIGEDELARLRQIEHDFLLSTNQGMDGSFDNRLERSLEKIGALQRKLSDERERGEAIVRQVSQGVMVLDKNGKILEMNPIAHKVLGVSTEAAKGKLLKDVVEDHHMLSVVSGWDKETADYIPKHIEIQAGNEETIDTIRESSIVIEDENGRPIGGVSALQDVVRQKELESRKNDILDVLGHDLRTPLTVVKQSISLMADSLNLPEKVSEAQQEKILSACQRNVERLEKLVNKILDVRQLETGKIILKKESTEANKLIEDAALSLGSWARDKHISIELELEALPDTYCDSERIYQVITNLVSNALKFTPEGGCIQVQGRTADRAGTEFVEVSVTDSGVGIHEDDLERIFNRYEQVSLCSPEGVSGLGLGLSTCKTIIEMHDGAIWVNSNLGQGSTFTFQISVAVHDPESS
jgi:PAS domain S-box-containing protein